MPSSGDVLVLVLLVLHVTFAAVWFANRLGLPSDMRDAIRAMEGPEHGLAQRIRRSVRLDGVGAAGVFVTGGLLVYRRGFGDVDLTVWVGAAVAVGLVVMSFLVTRPARRTLRAALSGGHRPEATAAARRVIGAMSVEGFLWLVALVLMFF